MMLKNPLSCANTTFPNTLDPLVENVTGRQFELFFIKSADFLFKYKLHVRYRAGHVRIDQFHTY